MNKKTLQIFIILIVSMLLLIFFLAILDFVSIETFWVGAIITVVFAFLVLPKLNKNIHD